MGFDIEALKQYEKDLDLIYRNAKAGLYNSVSEIRQAIIKSRDSVTEAIEGQPFQLNLWIISARRSQDTFIKSYIVFSGYEAKLRIESEGRKHQTWEEYLTAAHDIITEFKLAREYVDLGGESEERRRVIYEALDSMIAELEEFADIIAERKRKGYFSA